MLPGKRKSAGLVVSLSVFHFSWIHVALTTARGLTGIAVGRYYSETGITNIGNASLIRCVEFATMTEWPDDSVRAWETLRG
jgi:hypothetical protein